MEKNGTTSKGSTRWRCTHCGASTTKRRPDLSKAADFGTFITYATSTASITEAAATRSISRYTLTRRFRSFWLIDIPNQPDAYRIYD